MVNLLRYYLHIILIIVGFAICDDIHKDGLFFSVGLSDFADKMENYNELSDNNQFNNSISVGYSRVDLMGRRSGLSIMCLIGVQHPLDQSSIYDEGLFGINLVSFFNAPVISKMGFQLNAGAKSYFDLGYTNNNIALGPTIGASLIFHQITFSLEYFKGCMDFIDFSIYTDEISFQIYIQELAK